MKILGVISKTDLDSKQFERSLLAMRTSDSFCQNQYITSDFCFGYLKLPHEPYQQQYTNKGVVAYIDGYIYNPDFIDKKTPIERAQNLEPFLSIEEVIQSFLAWGIDFIKNLNGSFNIVIFNQENNNLHIINDRHATKSIFYSWEKHEFRFCSEIKAFPSSFFTEENINWRTVASILTFEQGYGSESVLKNVSLLPRASVLKYGKSGVSITQYHKPIYTSASSQSDREIEEKTDHLYKNAIVKAGIAASTLTKKLELPLSGGYDSRLICSVLKKYSQIDFTTIMTDKDAYIQGTTPADSPLAKKIAKKLRVDNKYIELPKDVYRTNLLKRIYLFDGMTTMAHEWISPLVSKMKSGNTILDGFAGDYIALMSERSFEVTKDFINRRDTTLAELFIPPQMDISRPHDYYGPKIPHDIAYTKECLKDSIYEYMSGTCQLQMSNMISKLDPKSPSLLASYYSKSADILFLGKILGEKSFLIYTFLENQLFNFLMSIPAKRKAEMEFTRGFLNRLIPESMEVESTNDITLKKQIIKEVVFSNNVTRDYYREVIQVLEMPKFIKIKRRDMVALMDKWITDTKNRRNVAFIDFLIWCNVFILKKELPGSNNMISDMRHEQKTPATIL